MHTPRRLFWFLALLCYLVDALSPVATSPLRPCGHPKLLSQSTRLSSPRFAIDPSMVDSMITFEPRGVTAQDTAVFVAGCLPFAWATVEFWRRIAVGESFGTGSDSVIIGEDLNPESSRGRRVLGKDAFFAAYVLFGIAGASLVLAFLSGMQLFID
mmetsp:Transcript_45737/g.103279  ORF Transcript_45737/g.103279 Transcript_45737/m.103279 type:complete len:156 (-) Transcript_45737:296-763(-)